VKIAFGALNNPLTGNLKRAAQGADSVRGLAKFGETSAARYIPGGVKRASIIIDAAEAAKLDPELVSSGPKAYAYWADAVFGGGRNVEKDVVFNMSGDEVKIPIGPLIERTPFKTYPIKDGQLNTKTKAEKQVTPGSGMVDKLIKELEMKLIPQQPKEPNADDEIKKLQKMYGM
jgi:hypothetical protein